VLSEAEFSVLQYKGLYKEGLRPTVALAEPVLSHVEGQALQLRWN
jgi:hypothetical protein